MVTDRNKDKFLKDLREYLSVLEDQEQEDILEEYAQHIDMKMQKGLSEEEAIRDFGSVKELAADILAAYHVDSEHVMSAGRRGTLPTVFCRNAGNTEQQGSGRYAAGKGWLKLRRCLSSMGRLKPHGEAWKSDSADGILEAGAGHPEVGMATGFFQYVYRQIRGIVSGTVHRIRKSFCWMGRKCRYCADWCRKPFRGKWESDMVEDEFAEVSRNDAGGWLEGVDRDSVSSELAGADRNSVDDMIDGRSAFNREVLNLQVKREATRIKEERKGTMGGFFRAMCQGMQRIWKWFLACCLFWMRLLWNMSWLIFSLLCASMAMFALMGVGMTIVLIYSGYPFLGIFILGLGGMLCFGALAAGAFGMMVKKKEEQEDRKGGRMEREVHYEQTA